MGRVFGLGVTFGDGWEMGRVFGLGVTFGDGWEMGRVFGLGEVVKGGGEVNSEVVTVRGVADGGGRGVDEKVFGGVEEVL